MPDPPDFVDSDAALAIWNTYGPALNKLGLLESLDALAFGMLCDAIAAYVHCRDELKTEQLVICVGDGGALQQHPLVAIVRSQSKAVREFLNEFGMTPGSRTQLTGSTAATPEEPALDPLEALQRQFGLNTPAPAQKTPEPVTPRKRLTKRTKKKPRRKAAE